MHVNYIMYNVFTFRHDICRLTDKELSCTYSYIVVMKFSFVRPMLL